MNRHNKATRQGVTPRLTSAKAKGAAFAAAGAPDVSSGNLPQLMTVAEVSSLLRVEASTIYVWTSKRKIPFRKVGGRLRFDRDEILRWTVPED